MNETAESLIRANGAKRTSDAGSEIKIVNWGLIEYQEALNQQLELVEMVQVDPKNETIIFCAHPPVVTLGRATEPGDVSGWTGPVHEIQRGGRATYHGPSQLVVYPILDLDSRGRDLHGYIRGLENAIIATLGCFGLEGKAEKGATGVWVGDKKVASIGIGVKKWVTYHGLALNVRHDPQAFQGINPCGFEAGTMTSIEELLGTAVEQEDTADILRSFLTKMFSARSEARDAISTL
ncbi:MAG: lipoyl(octanoyl) transferase LipB [Bdellovibrionia bacterium]